MRRLGRVLGWVAGVLVLLVAGLALSIVVEGLLGSRRVDALTNTRIANAAGPEVRAYVARPPGDGPHPAVIMIHEWWGLREDVVGKAEALAQEGYVVVAPDTLRGSSTAWFPRAIYQVSTAPPEQAQTDLDAVFAWLSAQPDVDAGKIAIMGFCYGGRTALLYSMRNPQIAATATFYGLADTTPDQLRGLGPVLGVWGGADNSIPLDEVRALDANLAAAGVPHTFRVFDGQPHAFVTSIEEIRKGGPQGEAWDTLVSFLQETLQSPGAARSNARPLAGGDSTTALGWLHHLFVCRPG